MNLSTVELCSWYWPVKLRDANIQHIKIESTKYNLKRHIKTNHFFCIRNSSIYLNIIRFFIFKIIFPSIFLVLLVCCCCNLKLALVYSQSRNWLNFVVVVHVVWFVYWKYQKAQYLNSLTFIFRFCTSTLAYAFCFSPECCHLFKSFCVCFLIFCLSLILFVFYQLKTKFDRAN